MSKLKTYYAKKRGENGFIAIRHGEIGGRSADVFNQFHADTLNKREGVSIAQVSAAYTCSMFQCWDKFDAMAASIQDALDRGIIKRFAGSQAATA